MTIKLTKGEEEFYAELAQDFEDNAVLGLESRQATVEEEAALDEAIFGEDADSSPSLSVPIADQVMGDTKAEMTRAHLGEALASAQDMEEIGRLAGRYSLGISARQGKSPVRQVRLPVELDNALTRRMETEQRKRSEIVRDAIEHYLKRAS